METLALTGGAGGARDLPHLASLAARLLAAPSGPRVAVLESDGWDTHGNQLIRQGRKLNQLDRVIAELRQGLGETWSQTAVVTMTEFGRTAVVNGTGGTDHGTGTVLMMAGGLVNGGRVIADWPGLAPAQLLDARDLRPTLDLRAVMAGAMAELFELDPRRTADILFPDTRVGPPLQGLIRT